MDDMLLEKYLEYANTEESFAVLFTKKHLVQAKGHWVDIENFRRYEMSSDNLHFRFVVGSLYKRKINPSYLSKSLYTINGKFDERGYYMMTRAITWETAHKDIAQQKFRKVVPLKFEITGVSYDKNRNNKGYFRNDAPPEIKALAENICDRTNPLWDKAMQYINVPEFVYEIRRARIIEHDA